MASPGDLYRSILRYVNGDNAAGWEAVMSRQLQALIERQCRVVSRYKYVDRNHVEDIRSDLQMRVLARLREFTLPDHGDDVTNEKAIVAYFKLAIRDLTTQSVRLIVSPDALRTGESIDVHTPISQLGSPGAGPLVMDGFDGHILDPQASLERNDRALIMALCRRFFESDDDAVQGFSALQAHAMGCDDWGDIAESIGISRERRKRAQYLASRYRNVMRAAVLESGHDCEHTIMSIYTSHEEGVVTVLNSNGLCETRVTPVRTVFASEAFMRSIRDTLQERDITFVFMNRSDTSSVMRCAALMALHNRPPLISYMDAEAVESEVLRRTDNPKSKEYHRLSTGRRRSILMARAASARIKIITGEA